jgi:hypothetical protein
MDRGCNDTIKQILINMKRQKTVEMCDSVVLENAVLKIKIVLTNILSSIL